ncbi:MAG: response regulator [Hyphomonadaceae bacterium]|nr:response regulator [Hyphomonadaceae bacterium]
MPRPSRSALIVSDSAPLRRYAVASLEGIRIVCTEAANGYQALERLGEKPFSLYVLDLDMPPSDGLAIFAITLFSGYRDPSPVVIGHSARPAGEARQGPWPGKAGLAALLPKPFHPAELIAAALAAFAEQPEDPSDL